MIISPFQAETFKQIRQGGLLRHSESISLKACLWLLLGPIGLYLETARAVYEFESGYEIPGLYRRTQTRRIHTRSVQIW